MVSTKGIRFNLKTWIALYAALFLISFLLYLFIPSGEFRVVAFFPDAVNGQIRGEEHFLPYSRNSEARVEEFVRHIMLGPKEVWNASIFPKETKILGLVVGKNSVYVNLSREAFLSNDININFLTSLDIFKKNIMFNFRQIKKVYITVEGALPYEPPFIR